jgi:hypothetical protein
VQSIAVKGTYPTIKYFINEKAEKVSPLYDLTPSDCTYDLDLVIKVDGSTSLPEPITFDSATGVIQILTTDFAAEQKVYEVSVLATDRLTSVSNSLLVFKVNITCIQGVTIDDSTAILDFIYPIVLASQ